MVVLRACLMGPRHDTLDLFCLTSFYGCGATNPRQAAFPAILGKQCLSLAHRLGSRIRR